MGKGGTLPAYLIEEPFGKLLEALGADEALLMVQLPIAVDNFLRRGKATPAALTDGVCKRIGHVAVIKKKEAERKLAELGSTTGCGALFFPQSQLHQPNARLLNSTVFQWT